MIPRLIAAAIIVAFALAALSAAEHAATNNGLPLVNAQLQQTDPPAFQLFAPCPVGPRNIPRTEERDA